MTDEGLTDVGAAANAGLAEGTILKILSGVQSGVEVSLVPGQYVIGSGGDDDIQIIDVSLAPGHLQLRVGARGVQIRAMSGSVRTSNGIALEPNSDWHEVEPLDVLTVGTTRLALGPVTAAWTSITDIEETNASEVREEVKSEGLNVRELLSRINLRKQALPLLALLLVIGLAVWYLSSGGDGSTGRRGVSPASVTEIRNVLGKMPFANDITIRQEVDGTIYATGYVDTVIERRAIASAIEETGVPVYLRIWVLQSMRQEIEGIIEAQKRKVTFEISRSGVVTLNGIIPDDAQAEEFINTIKEGVLGVNGVVSNLRTPSSLLAEIEKLAQSSRIKPWVLFRFDNGLIEATGALPAEEADSWSGFLQVYARRFARDIGLRSFVQLQDVRSAGAPAHAITIGAPAQNSGDVEVDISRIQEGNFAPGDVLIGAGADQSQNKSDNPGQSRAETKPNELQVLPDGGGNIVQGHDFPISFQVGLDEPTYGGVASVAGEIGRLHDAAVPGMLKLSSLRTVPGQRELAGMDSFVVPPATQRQADAVSANVATKDASADSASVTHMGTLAVRPPTEGLANPVRAAVSLSGASSATNGMSDILSVSPSAGIAAPISGSVMMGAVPPAGVRDSAADIGLRSISVMPSREEMTSPVSGDIQVSSLDQPEQGPQAAGMSSLLVPPAEENKIAPVETNIMSGQAAPATNLSLSDSTRLLLEQWRDGRLQQGANANSLLQALERLNRDGSNGGGAASRLARQQLHDRYLPATSSQQAARDVCWPASQLRPQDAAAAIFWLDILSVGQTLSLSSFDNANQRALLEVALNPRRAARCIARAYPETDILDRSVYLREIKRNPAFIRFIVRDLTAFPLQVSGASPAGDVRFIQTPTGLKINEGSSPDDSSRLLVVGELGAVVEVPRGIAPLIYSPDLVWLLD